MISDITSCVVANVLDCDFIVSVFEFGLLRSFLKGMGSTRRPLSFYKEKFNIRLNTTFNILRNKLTLKQKNIFFKKLSIL